MDTIYAVIPVSHFDDAKTRLSPFLEPEERELLLKAMLSDVYSALESKVDKIIIISSDDEVLDFAKELGAETLVETDECKGLNPSLEYAMKWAKNKCERILIIPSDIPLLGRSQLEMILPQVKEHDFIISPAKGTGTNLIIMKPGAIGLNFGDYSFFKHVKAAMDNHVIPMVLDSFFISLDVNTTEDLGEIFLHGSGTKTGEYLKSLNLSVVPVHGAERLKVTRKE